jgi:hypothetical protein
LTFQTYLIEWLKFNMNRLKNLSACTGIDDRMRAAGYKNSCAARDFYIRFTLQSLAGIPNGALLVQYPGG